MIKTFRVFETGSVTADIISENTPQNVVLGGMRSDLGIVMPQFVGEICSQCRMLLLPYNRGSAGENVITYGMEPQSDITLSSVGENRCVMTVQREIFDIWGNSIEPQDIVISRMHLEPDMALATAAALLLSGAGGKMWGI